MWCPLRSTGLTYCSQTMFFLKENILYIQQKTKSRYKRKTPICLGILYKKLPNSSVVYSKIIHTRYIERLIIQSC